MYLKRNVGYGTLHCKKGWNGNVKTANVFYSVWGADFNLALSHSRLRSPVFHPNDDECFLNQSKIEQPIGKGRVRGRGREGVGAETFYRAWA